MANPATRETHPRKPSELELKVGLFVSIGVILILSAILLLGGASRLLQSYQRYETHYRSADGLITGAKIMLNGLNVGSVEKVDLDPTDRDVRVTLRIDSTFSKWIREDSTASIATQGVLGDRYISLSVGSSETPELPPGGKIRSTPGTDLSTAFGDASQLMIKVSHVADSLDRLLKSLETNGRSDVIFQNLASTSRNLASSTEKLNRELDQIRIKSAVNRLDSILKKMDEGSGTIGALINDPQLYLDARTLMGGANRNRVVRNLVRKTIQDAEEETKASSASPKSR